MSAAFIPIGIVHSRQGPMAISELPLIEAALLAVKEINEGGGLLGKRIRPFVADGMSQDDAFAREAEDLIRNKNVCALFGCWTSSSRKTVKAVVERTGSLLWYPIQYEGLEQSPNIVYTGSCLNQQIAPVVEWALAQGRKRFALVGSDYVFPRTANKLVKSMLATTNAQIVHESYHPLTCRDYEWVLEPLSASQPDFIINTINGLGNIDFLKPLHTVASLARPELVCSMSCPENLYSGLSRTADGQLACWGYFESIESQANTDFLNKLKRTKIKFSSDPIATAYSQVMLWASIVGRIGSFDTADVRANLAGSWVDCPLGRLEIQENRHVLRNAYIGRCDEQGRFEPLWQSDGPIAPLPWLGVDKIEMPFKELVMQLLHDLPEDVSLQGRLEAEIEERRKLSIAMAKNERRLLESESIARVGGFERDFKTGEGYWSDTLFSILGYPPNAFVPSLEVFWRHIHEEDQEEFQRIMAVSLFEASEMNHQCRIRRADGEVRHIQLHGVLVRDESGSARYHGTVMDVTERVLAEEKVRLLARTDELTGIYNRRRFIELASKEIERSNRYPGSFALIMFDLDKFKNINDMYGHDVGDHVLRAVARCAGSMAREVDIVGRLGGEEFAIALPQTDLRGALVVAERVRHAVECLEIVVRDITLRCTVSLGVAELAGCADNVDSILKASDLAMYRAKAGGRNRVESMIGSDLDVACAI